MPYMELPYRYLAHCIPLQMLIIFVGGGAFLLWEEDFVGGSALLCFVGVLRSHFSLCGDFSFCGSSTQRRALCMLLHCTGVKRKE